MAQYQLIRLPKFAQGQLVTANTMNALVRENMLFAYNKPTLKSSRSATQSISDSTWTAVAFTAIDSWDTDGMHAASSDTVTITSGTGAWSAWHVNYTLNWATNATGVRGVRLSVVGDTTYTLEQRDSLATSVWHNGSRLFRFSPGTQVQLEVYQSSGGALNLSTAALSIVFAGTIYDLY